MAGDRWLVDEESQRLRWYNGRRARWRTRDTAPTHDPGSIRNIRGMTRRPPTVRQLGDSSGLDIDEVLIRLWDGGLDAYTGPDDRVSSEHVKSAYRAIGMPTSGDLRRPEYWQRALGLDAGQFKTLLEEHGFGMSGRARLLPKGAVARLKRVARGQVLQATPPVLEESSVPASSPPLQWRTIGREREVRLLGEEEVERIHLALVADFARARDPIDPPGIRDPNLLASAVFRQHTAFGGTSKYRSVEMAGAALLHSIVHDHPFHNGNKRTGLVSMIVLLDENGLTLTCNEEALFKFIVRVAQHGVVPRQWGALADREVLWIAEWIRVNSRTIEKGERPVQWRRLKQVLSSLDCTWEATGAGRMNITREVSERGLLLLRTRRVLWAQVKYADDGREASRYAIHELRRKLELDEDHGVDSARFYSEAPPLDDFILRYSKTLRRLARL